MAIAYVNHTFIGKSTQAKPYHAVAHAKYVMRKSAAMRIFSERMPRNYHAVLRYLTNREDTIRKNGRVIDKLMIAIPKEFSPEQAEKVLRRWANGVGEHRTPWLMAFHWDDHNPHAHCIFIDADIETGKRVAMTSEKGTTDKLKVAWEDAVNEQFKELGLDTRISFTETAELQAENDNVAEQHHEPVADVHASEPLPTPSEELEEAPLEEEEVAVIEQEGATIGDKARLGAEATFELRRIRTIQQERQTIKERWQSSYDAWQNAMQGEKNARLDAQKAMGKRDTTRETYLTEHRGIFGKKGFKLSAFGYSYTSPARKAADAAEAQYQWASTEAEQAALAATEAQRYMVRSEDEYHRAEAEYDAIQGTEGELKEAEVIMEATVNEYVGDLSRETILAMGEDDTLSPEQVKVLLEELGYDKGQEKEL